MMRRFFLLAWTVMALLGLSVSAASAQDITTGIVGHWALDETGATTTASGTVGPDGAMQNGLSGTNTTAGKAGTALHLDGGDDFISLSGNAALHTAQTTVCAWARSTGPGDGEDFQIIAESQEWPNAGFSFHFWPEPNTFTWRVLSGGSGNTYDVDAVIDTTQWHHYCGSFDGTTSRLYVDGALADSKAASYTPSVSKDLAVGGALAGVAALDGDIDDVRIYDRALTSADVTALYNYTGGSSGTVSLDCEPATEAVLIYNASIKAMQYCNGTRWIQIARTGTGLFSGGGGSAPTNGLVAHWKFDETTGLLAVDSAGDNDATIGEAYPLGTIPVWEPSGGMDGGSLNMDGDGDQVVVPDHASLDLTSFTLSTWAKFDMLGNYSIFNKTSDDASYAPSSYYFFYDAYDEALYCGFHDGTDWRTVGASGFYPALGVWHRLSCTFDNTTKSMKIYVNAQEMGSGTLNYTPMPDNYPLQIGVDLNTWCCTFGGSLDDVRIYNRALTPTEISSLYTSMGGTQICSGATDPGDACSDGTVFAGYSNFAPLYTTRCDLGQTWNGTACTGTRSQYPFNNGNGSGFVLVDTTSMSGFDATEALLTIDSNSSVAGSQPHQAAAACAALTSDGHSDWYLPTYSDLDAMYNAKVDIDNFVLDGSYYRTVSANELENSVLIRMNDGYVYNDGDNKQWGTYIRCVRNGS